MVAIPELVRHRTHAVDVGGIVMGGGAPVVVQSMTNTDTGDADSTTRQIIELAKAGSEIVRITVNDDAAARAVPVIVDRLRLLGWTTPIVGDFHFNGHTLLRDHPEMARSLAKYRINPGNVGFGKKRDVQFEQMIEAALRHDRPVRIGVNWGSLDQDLATSLMDRNAASSTPRPADEVMREAMILSALQSAEKAEALGLGADRIVISTKLSQVQDLVAVYRELARRSHYALHLGLTEAGMGTKGIVASAAALALLLQDGIGDTIRCSLTPKPGEARTREVEACKEILQVMGFRQFAPSVAACPGCGRTTSTLFQELALSIQTWLDAEMPRWKESHPGVETMKVAVMGCIVNGPGESKHADIGISLPGSGENPAAPVFIDGEKRLTLRGETMADDFKALVLDYIEQRFGRPRAA